MKDILRKMKWIPAFAGMTILTASASAYELKPGDWILHGVIGPSINVVREQNITRETPGAGALIGAELEYVFDKGWAATGALRPMFAPSFLDLGLGFGVKYRWNEFATPFIPYAAISLTPALLIPTGIGSTHLNLGLRGAIGSDYFIMRNVAVGIEVAMEPSLLMGSNCHWFEFSTEVLLGLTWRL